MKKQNEKKLFAFKVAEIKTEVKKPAPQQWQARQGVATAGCSFPSERAYVRWGDNGIYC